MDGEGEYRASPLGGSVGDRLRAAREAQRMSLEEVAERTRVPRRHLAMIEEGDYSGLPAPTYSTGFVKAYARLLGLDGQALSDQFRAEAGSTVAPPSRPEPYEPADPRRTPPLGLALAVLVVALIAGLFFLYWRGSTDQASELAARGVAPVASSQPTRASAPATTQAAPAPAQNAGAPVVVGAAQDVWIKIASTDKTLFMGTLRAGDHFQVPADAPDPTLTTGRPAVTTISVGATPIPPVGDPDRAAHNVSLKPEALLARVATPGPPVQPPAGAPTPVQNVAGPA